MRHFSAFHFFLGFNVLVPVTLSVAENQGRVTVCSVITTGSNSIVNNIDIAVTLSTSDGTGMYVIVALHEVH